MDKALEVENNDKVFEAVVVALAVCRLLLELLTALLDFPALLEALLHAEKDGDARALRETLGQLLDERERIEVAVTDGEKLLVTDVRDDRVSVPLIEIVDFA